MAGYDAETGRDAWINSDSRKVRAAYQGWFRTMNESTEKLLRRYHVDAVSIATNEDYAKGLMAFFKKR